MWSWNNFSKSTTRNFKFTKNVLTADIHTRHRNKRFLKNAGAEKVLGLDDIMTSSINGSGYNEEFGLLGSNKSTEDKVKLFKRSWKNLPMNYKKTLKSRKLLNLLKF